MGELVRQIEIDEAEAAARSARFPIGSALEFADLELDSRVGALDRLRDFEPISWVPALGGWLVTSHELARELLSRGDAFTVWAEPNLVRASLGVMMLTSDGAEHARQRQPFDEPFRVRPVRERFSEPVASPHRRAARASSPRAANASWSRSSPRRSRSGSPATCSASRSTTSRACRSSTRRSRAPWSTTAIPSRSAAPTPRAPRSNAILLEEVQRSRTRPDNSITSAVANDPARGLSDDEIVAQLRVILFGAIETVESTIANAVLLLLQHPDQLAILRAEPGFAGNAIEEGMRLIPPVAFIERWTAVPCELGGVELAEGEFLGVSTVAANRDPAVFPAPERFDVRRGNARHHLTLSHGHHHCLGFNLGRMQCQAAVTALFDRLPGLEIVHAPEPTGFAFRRPATLAAALGRARSPGSGGRRPCRRPPAATSTRSASCSTGTCSAPRRSAVARQPLIAPARSASSTERSSPRRTAFSSSPLSTWCSRAKRSRELDVASASVSVSRETPKWQAAPSSAESAICSATAWKPPGSRHERSAQGLRTDEVRRSRRRARGRSTGTETASAAEQASTARLRRRGPHSETLRVSAIGISARPASSAANRNERSNDDVAARSS